MDPKVKQKVLRMISNGMYVITSRHEERVGAATVTWLSQASFKPPLIMAAVRQDSNVFECLSQSRVASVQILASHQQDIARKFLATTQANSGMINGEPYVDGKTKSPILVNAPAFIECSVRQIVDEGGDHAVVILEVLEAEIHPDAVGVKPLLIAESPWRYGG
ncbi:MAG: flavin reductase family protein [Bacteroidota bacterium]